tara:strand:- start:7 stop:279 length:273 start_codon:yes stop_codon:yes gene_type:complete
MWRTRVDGVDGFNFTVMDERPPRTGRWTARRAADGLQGDCCTTAGGLQMDSNWTRNWTANGLQTEWVDGWLQADKSSIDGERRRAGRREF